MRRLLCGIALTVTVVLLALAPQVAGTVPARAAFTAVAPAATTVTSSVLQPPGTLSVTTHCSLLVKGTATATWTPSPSTYVTGYTYSYTASGGTPTRGTLAATATSVTFPISSTLSTYTASVTATYRSWTSTAVTSASFGCVL